jgi:hypothetical protein
MRAIGVIVLALMTAGCVAKEEAGLRAAKMEARDDTSCRQLSAGLGAEAYSRCRKSLLHYRQQVLADRQQEQTKREAFADSFAAARRVVQRFGNQPEAVSTKVNCFFWCR